MLQVVLTEAPNRENYRTPSIEVEELRPSLAIRLAWWANQRLHAYLVARRYRKTVRTLAGLDDRTLHDIGIDRSEITSYASRGGDDRHPSRRQAPLYVSPY
jgi:uncharacterized protein YjiS (DUF1127 family)